MDGHVGVLKYMLRDGLLTLVHTEVPEEVRGRRVAESLARFALDSARRDGLRVKVACPSVQRFIERHPEYADFVVSE